MFLLLCLAIPAGGQDGTNNPPVFAGDGNFVFQETTDGSLVVGDVRANDPDAEDEVTGYALSGDDADRFLILTLNLGRLLLFKDESRPDYEDPQDVGADNVYNLTVTAASGSGDRELTQALAVTVTVTNDPSDDPVVIWDVASRPRLIPLYNGTRKFSLTDYLAGDGTGVEFALQSCDTDFGDYFDSVAVGATGTGDAGKLVVVSNSRGHVHGPAPATTCTVSATLGGTSGDQAFDLYLPSPRRPGPMRSALIQGTTSTTITVRIDESHQNWIRLLIQEQGRSNTRYYVVRNVSPSTDLTFTGLTPATAYSVSLARMNRPGFHLWGGHDSTGAGVLALATPGGFPWSSNLRGGGVGRASPAVPATTEAEPELSVGDVSVTEGSMADFAVTLAPSGESTVTVDYTTVDGTAAAGADYTATSGTLTFAAGETSKTISVQTVDDTAGESDEVFTVTLSGPSNAALSDDTGQATITDNDESPPPPGGDGTPPDGDDEDDDGEDEDEDGEDEDGEDEDDDGDRDDGDEDDDKDEDGDRDDDEPEVRIDDARAMEDAGSLTFAMSLDSGSSVPVTVDWATSAGTATPEEDYTEASGTLTIPPGETSGIIQVAVLDDDVEEDEETLTVTLSSPTNATLVEGGASATGMIVDNDDPPRIMIADAEASEDEGGLSFPVTLTAETVRQITVDWATAAGTATPGAGRDYTESSGTLTFMPGQKARTIHVPVRDDRVQEDDETLSVSLSGPTNATIADDMGTATGTIADNDAYPRILVSDASAFEREGELAFEIKLEGRSANPISVEWATSGGTAKPDADYLETTGTLILGPAAVRGTIFVEVVDDDVPEETEVMKLTLSKPINARINGHTISATGTILDTDKAAGPPPAISVADSAALESSGRLVFTATLNRAAERTVTASWATREGTATADLDYVESHGTVIFPSGETSAEIPVEVLDDLLHEGIETFRITLSEPVNATIYMAGAAGVIRDDDGPELSEHWLSRFSRTAASHALEAVEDRVGQRSGHGSHVTVAGHRIDFAQQDPAPDLRAGSPHQRPHRTGGYALEYLLQNSSFHFSSEGDEAGVGSRWSIWGRGATTRFGGGERLVSVEGDIATGTVGIDFERGRVLFGVAASHTYGEGDAIEHGRDRRVHQVMESTLTTGLPYLRVALSESLSMWGVLGHGRGSMTMTEGDLGSVDIDIAMNMGALGFRQNLRKPASQCRCFDLALKADYLMLNATGDESFALPELSRDLTRARLMMEGSRTRRFDSGAVLTPSAEVGFRYDGGDAETGAGMEFGAGIQYANPAGVRMELKGRSLLTHQSGDLTEWGVAGALQINPAAGISFNLGSSFGNATSGVGRLWEQQQGQMAFGYRQNAMQTVTEADLGYRLFGSNDRVDLVPYVGAGLSEQSGHAFRLGARLRLRDALDISLEGIQRDGVGSVPRGFVLGLRGSLHW
ncbi:MAG: hypothetical protein OXH70_16845 [Acidobacteria bacterium]|nr:hypothetical protein [Acidobacteriota bacterium]